MRFSMGVTSLVVGAFLSQVAYAEQHHGDSKSFRMQAVSEQITLLQGKGGNVAVLSGDQGTLIVDDDYKQMSDALIKTLDKFGGTEKLTYIINTHWHGDHTQGNEALGHHARIIAHDNVRERLLTSQEVKLFKMVTEPYPDHALPSITYSQRLKLHINNEEVELMHYAGGHTDGDSVVYFNKANVVHMGDHFFNGFFPFVDVDNGGNVSRMAENVAAVLQRIDDKTVVIPGHGPVGNKADLQAFLLMLEGTELEVKALLDKGLSLEQIQAQGLSEKWNEWTDGFLSAEVWIGIIYSSLMKG